MKFRKLVNDKNRIRTPASTGDKITQPYGWIYKDGEYQYLPKGNPHNHYEEIQAQRDAVDLKKILARYESGDTSALERVNGFYLDTVELPKSLADLYDAVSRSNEVFDAMPIEIKEKYGHNPASFWKAHGTESFDNFLNEVRQSMILGQDPEPIKTAPTPVSEVTLDKEVKNESEHE